MLAKSLSSTIIGVDAHKVEVEVDITKGLPFFAIVGLPETSVRESKERVKSAIGNSGYKFPYDRIIINLAPADIKKEGTGFDLPIAAGILAASGIFPKEFLSRYFLLGELSLDGKIKPVKGSLSMAISAKNSGYEGIIIPKENSNEAGVVKGIKVFPVSYLSDVVEFFNGYKEIEPLEVNIKQIFKENFDNLTDFAEIKGQEHVKRAMEIAAAGGHNILLSGIPGSGKTMISKSLPTIMPPLTFKEAIEITKIYSVAGLLKKNQPLVTQRVFRSPHHTISDAGLVGGGSNPKPGEISLAHNGVLFLDELPEFRKSVLEVLRQPLEDQCVTISRVASQVTYPSKIMLVAAMNPCPCGYYTSPNHQCLCSPVQIQRYRSKISGPLLDRIDLHIDVPAVPYKDLLNSSDSESSAEVRKRVIEARDIQTRRFNKSNIHSNSQMNAAQMKNFCIIDEPSRKILETAIEKLGLSARAYNRVLKISRTIADMDKKQNIGVEHISESIQYRNLDRF